MNRLASLRFPLILIAAGFTACATPAVVVISPDINKHKTTRVALLNISDYPGLQGSGAIAADTFEKYLLWGGYSLVERRQVAQLLQEQSFNLTGSIDPSTIRSIGRLLGVDALVLGSLTDFTNTRNETVMVDMPQEHTDPIYGRVTTVRHDGDATIKTEQDVITGYSQRETHRVVPETETIPAQVGLSVRLVTVQTGEILWSASGSSDGVNLTAALEEASSKIMQTVVEKLKKIPKSKS